MKTLPPKPAARSRLIVGNFGSSDSALAASSGWRLRRPAADRPAARCASRNLCSGGAPRRYPPSLVWRANGLDPLIGHRLPALLRAAGLVEVEVEVHGRADAPGAYHRKHLLALIEAVQGEVVRQGLFTESELGALTSALERHLDAPNTLVTRPLLFQAWGRKPTSLTCEARG